jgi:hypothetical protein
LLHKSGELLQAVERVAGAAEVRLATDSTVANRVGNEENSITTGLKVEVPKESFAKRVEDVQLEYETKVCLRKVQTRNR